MSAARRYICVMLSVLMVLCLCSCSKQSGDRLVTLSVMTMLGDDGIRDVYGGALSAFTLENEHVTVKDMTVRSQDAYKLGLSDEETYRGIDAPDIICVDFDLVNDAQLLESFASVNTLREIYPEYAQQIIPAALDCVRADNGVAYCVPYFGEYECMVVDTEIASRCGVSLDAQDIRGLRSDFEALIAGGVQPISEQDGIFMLESLVLSLGGKESYEKGIARDEQALFGAWRKAFEQYGELIAQPVSSSDVSAADVPLPENAQTAVFVADGKTAAQLSESGGYTLLSLPSDEKYMHADFSMGFLITDKACSDPERLKAAVSFVEFMTGAQQGKKLAQQGLLPSNSQTGESEGDSLAGEIMRYSAQVQAFVPRSGEIDRGFAADLSQRLSEMRAGTVDAEKACRLLFDEQSMLDNDASEVYHTSDTDLSNAQTP